MPYPDPLQTSGTLSVSEIANWMLAAGEIFSTTSVTLASLKAASHLTNKAAPHSVSEWYGYAIVAAIACGAGAAYSGGNAFPSENAITLGSATGNVVLTFDGQSVPDKFIVYFDGVKVIDTGYRGSSSYQTNLDTALANKGLPSETIAGTGAGTASFYKNTATATAIVYVYGPISGTAWSFTLSCPV